MVIIYLDRNNSFVRRLQVDGATVSADKITRALVFMPGAGADGSDVTFDTQSDNDIELIENATAVRVLGGLRDLRPGRYRAFLTCFDAQAPQGLAWDSFSITVRSWLPEVGA